MSAFKLLPEISAKEGSIERQSPVPGVRGSDAALLSFIYPNWAGFNDASSINATSPRRITCAAVHHAAAGGGLLRCSIKRFFRHR